MLSISNIFIFGSNEAGRHGKGAALYARKYFNATYGQGYGLQDRSFAIPTKDYNIQTLPITKIKIYVDKFIKFAEENPQYTFNLTRIGCGLTEYKDEEISPLFKNTPNNVNKPLGWN